MNSIADTKYFKTVGAPGGLEYLNGFSGPDAVWLLRQRAKRYKINTVVTGLIENLLPWILEINLREDLPIEKREVAMSIYRQKKSRNYTINISFRGKRTRVSSRCSSKQDAERVEALLLAQVIGSIFPATSHNNAPLSEPVLPTFSEASGQYLKDMCIGKKAAWKREEQCHRDLVPFFGERRIDQITPQLILKWREEETQRVVRGGKKISPRSVNYNLGYQKRLFNYAVKIQGWVKDNPASIIDPVPQNDKRDRVVSGDEIKMLLDACEHDWFRRLLVFEDESGFRVGEVASLKTGDFHLDDEIPHFKKKREKNNVLTEFPIVSERLVTVIKEQMSVRRTTDHFFIDEDGNPISIHNIGYWFRKAAAKAGIKNIIFGDLRRTFYSRLRSLGCNEMYAEYCMGHRVTGIASHYLVHNLSGVYEELKRVEETKKKRVIPRSYLETKETFLVPVLTA
jgi:integrase